MPNGATTPADPSKGQSSRRSTPMSAALAFVLGALVLLAALCVISIATWTGYRNTVDLLRQKAELLVSAAVDQLHIYLESTERQASYIAHAIESGELDPADVDNFVVVLAGALATTPQITSVGFVDREVRLTAAERDASTAVPVFAKLAQDNGWQAQLAEARSTRQGYWTAVNWRDEYRSAQLTRRQPVWRNDKFLGVVNVEVGINGLSELIGNLETDFGLNAFILEGKRHVIAHPALQFGFPDLTRWHPVPLIREIGDPVLMSIWDADARNDRVSRLLGAAHGHAVDLGKETYLFVYRTEDRYGGQWLIGSYLAASDVLKEIHRLVFAILACMLIVGLALLLSIWLGQRISRPVRLLAEQSRHVRNMDFDRTRPVPGSYIREVDEAAAAFNQMVEGLRERQMIRDLFGKYVPKSIVAELLRDKGRLNPRLAKATILFVDVAKFTSLSERLTPKRIVDTLNAYFSGVAEIIERHGGMITQFQGDAILAVYNVPINDPEHPQRAVETALELHRFVDGNTFEGQQLTCRVGINTGDVVAGNVGASERLNYTVHGDAVNVAARLEELNKEMGTNILVSATTAQHVRGVTLREIGDIKVRGKLRHIGVFTIA